jgi:hypothetical protein
MPETIEAKVRRVYLARKDAYGRAKQRQGWAGDIRNSARCDTAYLLNLPVAEVKRILKLERESSVPEERTDAE